MSAENIICIGGSSGAPMLAAGLLEQLPPELDAPVLLALHMPGPFVPSFVANVEANCKLKVVVGSDGDALEPGTVYVCPGGQHIGVNPQRRLVITPNPEGTPFKPSIDILFHTVSQVFGSKVIAVVLKGLTVKRDARQGALSVKNRGGRVLVQTDPNDVKFGMPRDVIESGGATDEVLLEDIPGKILQLTGRG